MLDTSRKLSSCLFTTTIICCCGLYALYKYALIDVETVMTKNAFTFGGVKVFDDKDYGIDVSVLRQTALKSDSGKAWMTIVEEWDSVVVSDNGVRMGYVADNCDAPNAVYGVVYLTKHSYGGLKVVVLVNYTAETDITIGSAEAVILAKFGNIIALNQTLELCSVDEELLRCPIKQGFQAFKREVVLPRFAPKGQYHGIVHLQYKDTKEIKLCTKGRMIL